MVKCVFISAVVCKYKTHISIKHFTAVFPNFISAKAQIL